MRFQAIRQIILIVVALVIVFTVIRPMVMNIQADQRELSQYQQAVRTAGQFNTRLNELLSRMNSLSTEDITSLEMFLPAELDPLMVSRDITAIMQQNQMIVTSVTAEDGQIIDTAQSESPAEYIAPPPGEDGMVATNSTQAPAPSLAVEARRSLVSQRFTVNALGTYEQMKQALRDMEQNIYPLRLVTLEFVANPESILLDFTMEVDAFALHFE